MWAWQVGCREDSCSLFCFITGCFYYKPNASLPIFAVHISSSDRFGCGTILGKFCGKNFYRKIVLRATSWFRNFSKYLTAAPLAAISFGSYLKVFLSVSHPLIIRFFRFTHQIVYWFQNIKNPLIISFSKHQTSSLHHYTKPCSEVYYMVSQKNVPPYKLIIFC